MTDQYKPTQSEKAGLEVAIRVLVNKETYIYDSGGTRYVQIFDDQVLAGVHLRHINQAGRTKFQNIEQLRGSLIAIGFVGNRFSDGIDYSRPIGGG